MTAATLLDAELAEQPDALARLLDRLPADIGAVRGLVATKGAAAPVRGVTLVARGSSDNVARYAQYLVPLRSGLPVALATPSLTTVYGRTPELGGQLVAAISQSGRSTDIVSVLAAASAAGCPTVAITNDPSSPLAREADYVLDLVAGAEQSVAATKTYTSSLVAAAALAVALGPADDADAAMTELGLLPDLLRAALELARGPAAATAQALHPATRAVAVGRGLNLSTAHETALKITELTATQVVPFSPADLLHGPVGAIGPEVPVLAVVPDEPATDDVLDLVPNLRERGAPVHALARPVSAPVPAGVDTVVPVPDAVPAWLSPVVAVVPGQLVARELARRRGVDVDRPGGLSKITVTH